MEEQMNKNAGMVNEQYLKHTAMTIEASAVSSAVQYLVTKRLSQIRLTISHTTRMVEAICAKGTRKIKDYQLGPNGPLNQSLESIRRDAEEFKELVDGQLLNMNVTLMDIIKQMKENIEAA